MAKRATKSKVVIATAKNLLKLQTLPQDTIIHAYKIIGPKGQSPIHHSRKRYRVGRTYRERNCNTNANLHCASGLHVATKFWCTRKGRRLMLPRSVLTLVEFKVRHIGCVPYCTSWLTTGLLKNVAYGKFRVKQLTIIKKIRW